MTIASEDRFMTLTVHRNRKSTARHLISELVAAAGAAVSRQTVYRRLKKESFMPESQGYVFQCLHKRGGIALIGAKNIRTGVNTNGPMFCLLMDESKFSFTGDSNRVYIWREPGTRNYPSNILEYYRFGSIGVMVWEGIMINRRTPLHVFDSGSVTGERYRDKVQELYVRLFRGASGSDFLFMDDNARPHRAKLVDEFLESEGIERIPWPAKSPDLNPIENLWDYLGRAIARRHLPSRNVNALKTTLL